MPHSPLRFAAALALAAGCARHANSPEAAPSSGADAAVAVPAGPWGTLRVIDHVLEPPEATVERQCDRDPYTWHFSGIGRPDFEQLLADAGVGDVDWLALTGRARCDAAGCAVLPTIDEVRRLDARAREVLYGRIVSVPADESRAPLFLRRPQSANRWRAPGMPVAARALVEERSVRLSGPTDGLVAFLDLPLLCRALDAAERPATARTAALRALASVPSLFMQIRVDATADLAALASFWGEGGREAEVRPLLDAFARVPGGAWVDVMHLLPRTPRSLLYRYPREGAPARDCHWTAFNFFRDQPDDALIETARVNALLQRDYDNVDDQPPRLGDILLFVRKEGETRVYFHSAVYVAADVVFTKNGGSVYRPWELMRLEDVRAIYHSATNVFRVRRRPAVALEMVH